MKKTKVKSVSCILLVILLMLSVSLEVHAREDVKQIDGSYLMDEDESTGYATPITRGDDLVAGYSKCVRLANGDLYVGGYYYRVVCVHSAGNDMSSSFTNGLFFE